MKDLTAQPYFGVMLTVVAYWLGMKVQKKTRLAICNGMLIAVLLVIAVRWCSISPMKATGWAGSSLTCSWVRPRPTWR